jgi:hypothetical protein
MFFNVSVSTVGTNLLAHRYMLEKAKVMTALRYILVSAPIPSFLPSFFPSLFFFRWGAFLLPLAVGWTLVSPVVRFKCIPRVPFVSAVFRLLLCFDRHRSSSGKARWTYKKLAAGFKWELYPVYLVPIGIVARFVHIAAFLALATFGLLVTVISNTYFSIASTALFLRPITNAITLAEGQIQTPAFRDMQRTKYMTLVGVTLALLSSTVMYANAFAWAFAQSRGPGSTQVCMYIRTYV